MATRNQKKRKLEVTVPDSFVTVAFQGQEGSFTSIAAHTFFAPHESKVAFLPRKNAKEIFESIIDDACVYGITPIESSSYGTIHGVYDKLLTSKGNLTIVGEIGLIETHCLCVKADQAVNDLDISHVYSHPHILECCSDFLDNLDRRRKAAGRPAVERNASWDSSSAGILIADLSTTSKDSPVVTAAICSKEAAAIHKLKILIHGIGNDKNAEVRIRIQPITFPCDWTKNAYLSIDKIFSRREND
jgi:prephenate dehydratase